MNLSFDAPGVYSSELERHAGQWLGHPLWYPEPDKGRGEVQIGDVGYIFEGRFKRIFNTVDEAVPSNDTRPDDFEPLVYDPSLRDYRECYLKPGPMPSESVKLRRADGTVEGSIPGGALGAGCSFECKNHQGAILYLQAPANMLSVEPNKKFSDYIKKHHRSWVHTIDQKLGSSIAPTNIILVRGWVKTSEWAVAAFKSSSRSASTSINASFNHAVGAGLELAVSDVTSMMSASNCGPKSAELASIPTPATSASDISIPHNQCIFLRYYKIKYRFGFFPKVMTAGAGPAALPEGPPEDSTRAVLASDDMDIETEAPEPIEQPVTSLDALLDHILKYSDAQIAIASDGELEMFVGHETSSDIANYLRIHRPQIHVDEDKVGMLSLESLLLGQQRRRRAQARHNNDEEADSIMRYNAGNSDSTAERVVLAGGKSLQWLDIVLSDTQDEGVAISSFSVSKNGERILTSLDNSAIKLWDIRTGEHIRDFVSHEDSVLSVAFSPDGTKFVSGSADMTAMLWDIDTAEVTSTLREHQAWVWCVAYSSDNQTIATGSFDQTVCLWNPNGRKRFTLEHEGQVTLLEFSPDGKSVLAGADAVALLWDCHSGEQIATLSAHIATIWSMKFSRDGDRIVTSSDDGTTRIWDARTGDELVTLHEHTGSVWAAEFSPDGRWIASGSLDQTISVCDSFSGESRFTVRDYHAHVHALAYSSNGKYIASGDADGLVKVWDATSGDFVAGFQGHSEKVKSVAWSRDDKSVVSSSDDGSVRIWSIRDVLRLY